MKTTIEETHLNADPVISEVRSVKFELARRSGFSVRTMVERLHALDTGEQNSISDHPTSAKNAEESTSRKDASQNSTK